MTTNNAPVPHGRLAFVRRLLDDPPPAVASEVLAPGVRRITALDADPQRAGAVRLSVDGERFATIGREDADGIRIGMTFDAALERRVQSAADTEGALRSGLASLARRAMARTDLERRLRRKGHEAAAAASAVERLARLGLLDDSAFAEAHAAAALRRGRGPVRVARDLGMMGVERTVAQAAIARSGLSESLAPDSEELARIATARLARLAGAEPASAKRRLLAFLARRGFQGSEVNALVRRLVAARESAADCDA